MKTLKELMDLHGRVALITGGAGHIGVAIAEALAELGANIVIVDLNQSDCERTCQQLKTQFSIETLALGINLANENEIRALPNSIFERLGQLDILVNCAALVGTSSLMGWAVPFAQQGSEAWQLALDINLTAPFILTQACAESLNASGHGTVINVGSIYGMVAPNWNLYAGTNMANPAAYGASKGGLLQLTRYLSTVMAPNVRVNMLTPGGVFRNQPDIFVERYVAGTPLHRLASEEDFKGAAAYLASDLSIYVTGQNLIVDGGWTTW
jgi:NAD(P)-dependent dehydrogenase (short-subunit alcohol dehydrogenase family)